MATITDLSNVQTKMFGVSLDELCGVDCEKPKKIN